jgi:hypothetical protein
MTAAQIVLFEVAVVQERTGSQSSAKAIPVVRAAVLQEEQEQTVTFQPMYPRPIPTPVKAAWILNLPSLLGGVVLAGVFHRESDASFIGFSALFVPLIWYPIGNWVDTQIAPGRMARKRIASRIAAWVLRFLAVLGLTATVFSLQGGCAGCGPRMAEPIVFRGRSGRT